MRAQGILSGGSSKGVCGAEDTSKSRSLSANVILLTFVALRTGADALSAKGFVGECRPCAPF